MRVAILVVVLFIGGLPSMAQADPMEVQRCIWRCLANSNGADDPAYQQCVSRQCGDGDEASSAPAEGRWLFGDHPILGRSAHVRMGDQAIGFACYDDRPDTGYTTALRMTPGIAPLAGTAAGASAAFVRPFSVTGTLNLEDTRQGYFEKIGGACDLGVESVRKPAEWIVINAPLEALTYADGVTTMTVRVDGQIIAIREEKDLRSLPGYWQVPLKGSASAIGKLIRSCSRIQAELRAGCGSGD